MANTEGIKNYLIEKFGLSDIEARLYLALLESGVTTILEMSRLTQINRATVHVNINNLIEKGLVSQTKTGRGVKRQIVAEPAEKLKLLIDQRKLELEEAEKALPDVISNISTLIPQAVRNTQTKVRYYEGKKAVKLLYEEMVKSDEIRAYVDVAKVVQVFPENTKLWISANHSNKNMKIWEIMNRTDSAKDYAAKMAPNRYSYKFVPENVQLDVIDYVIYDGKVGIINIVENPYALVINSEDFYRNAKSTFDLMWSLLPEVD